MRVTSILSVLTMASLWTACGTDSGGDATTSKPGEITETIVTAPPPLVPTHIDAGLLTAGSAALDLVAVGLAPTVVLNTDNGTLSDLEIVNNVATLVNTRPLPQGVLLTTVPQIAGIADLAVISATEFLLERDVILYVEGTRPLVIAVSKDARIYGTIDFRGGRLKTFEPGPGGYAGAEGVNGANAGKGPGAGQFRADCGGGGAGHRDPGGNGGGCGSGGSPASNPELKPLIGGSGGAAGKAANGNNSAGGGGGGAMMIAAAGTITVDTTAVLNAGGKGGQASSLWGAGGGAGGALLFEAGKLVIRGALVANGGGGGGGGAIPQPVQPGQPTSTNGNRGDASKVATAGGKNPSAMEVGGKGGAGDGKPTDGVNNGGGGGSAGRIRLCSMDTPQIRGVISPTPAILVGDCVNDVNMTAPAM